MSQRDHLVRVEMYRAAAELLESSSAPGTSGYYLPPRELSVLEISGDNFAELLPWNYYRSLMGVDVTSSSDLLRGLNGFRYDLVVLDQVLEHVMQPREALENVRNIALGRRGRVFVSTPFMIRVHPSPIDLWRWTREGLGELLLEAGFVDVHTGAWGNRAAVVANFDGWAIADEHSDMTNDPHFPVTVWALGTR